MAARHTQRGEMGYKLKTEDNTRAAKNKNNSSETNTCAFVFFATLNLIISGQKT